LENIKQGPKEKNNKIFLLIYCTNFLNI
jgi:hypothetical protein